MQLIISLINSERNTQMADKINISDLKFETYADKSLKVFSQMIAEPDNKFGIGSIAAEAAANCAALALRAVKKTASEDPAIETAEKDLETMRAYFVHLIDEENKAKAPLEKRLANNGPEDEIEGGVRTACAIVDEILYAVINTVNMLGSVSDKLCPCTAHIAVSSLFFARAAMDTVRVQLAMYSGMMNEEVYARTTRREPEIAIADFEPTISALIKKLEDMI